MLAAILVLFLLPFSTTNYTALPSVKSLAAKILFWLFVSNFLILMFLGGQAAAAPFVLCSKFFTVTYFIYILNLLGITNNIEGWLLKKNKKLEYENYAVPIIFLSSSYFPGTNVLFCSLIILLGCYVAFAREPISALLSFIQCVVFSIFLLFYLQIEFLS